MEIRKLNAARGWIWVKQGYQLIMRNPLLAIALALICALFMFMAFGVPLFGPLLVVVLMPVVIAGYMRVCRALEEEEEVELMQLLEGFQKHAARLVALGGFAMLGLMITSIAMIAIGGEAFAALLESVKATNDPERLADAMWAAGSGVALSLMVGVVLVFTLMLAMQYAPMLVFFGDMQPLAALHASLSGSLRNIVPYTVYSLIVQMIALALGMLPYGIGLIVLLPLGLTSLYVSYRNIFPFPNEVVTGQSEAPGTEA